MKIKLCGFKDENSIKAAIKAKCDFIGFIFFEKSPRNISIKDAVKVSAIIPENISKVAVIVDENIEFISKIINEFKPDFLQFHGNEEADLLKEVKNKFPQIKIIKAFKIKSKEDFKNVEEYNDFCDFFLFDGQNPGSGEKFDWKILENLNLQKDYFLSGGINIDNVEEAIKITKTKMIDISSGIEEKKGEKSINLITKFMNKVNSIC